MSVKTATTPSFVRTAFWLNLVLVFVGVITPRALATKEGSSSPTFAAMLFAIPMAMTLVIGAGAAFWAYILARREEKRLRWTAFLPASLFIVGCAAVLAMISLDL